MPKKIENLIQHKIKSIKFQILTKSEIEKLSVVEINNKTLYDVITRKPMLNGPLDTRLGVSNKNSACLTCNEPLEKCAGHFGYIKLCMPVYHIGFLKSTISILNCICKSCSSILISRNKAINGSLEFIKAECKKVKYCNNCKSANGIVKKNSNFRLYHELKNVCNVSNNVCNNASNVYKNVYNNTSNISSNISSNNTSKNIITLEINPITALNLLKNIKEQDLKYLGLKSNPSSFIIQNLIVPPSCIRPSVDMGDSFNEDDLTVKISEIINSNLILEESIAKGNSQIQINEDWDFLQLQVSLFINSDLPSIKMNSDIRGIVQRLKGKQGRFRCNLSGKRVDFSGRTVISPDPNLSIEEVGVPVKMASILTIPEMANSNNITYLQKLVNNGIKWPGANYIIMNVQKNVNGKNVNNSENVKRAVITQPVINNDITNVINNDIINANNITQQKIFLKFAKNKNIKIGDIVERHLQTGDIILFNRQPSLHRMSIMAHKVRIHNDRTLKFNECDCSPYNADFDGDEMNIHIPQTIEARAEASYLLGIKNNICTPRNNEPLISCTQDFLTGAFLISSLDRFFTRERFGQLCSYFILDLNVDENVNQNVDQNCTVNQTANQNVNFDKNQTVNQDKIKNQTVNQDKIKNQTNTSFFRINIKPAIISPVELFTGKQLIEVIIKYSIDNNVINLKAKEEVINLKAKNKANEEVLFWNNHYIKGRLDKAIIGSENRKGSLIYQILKISKNSAVKLMNSFSKLTSRFLAETGFSIGLDDVYPGKNLILKKKKIISEYFKEIENFNDDINNDFNDSKNVNNDSNKNVNNVNDNNVGNVSDNNDFNVNSNNKNINKNVNNPLPLLELNISSILNKIREDCGNVCLNELSKFNSPLIMQECGSKGSKINISQMIACVGQQIISGKRIPNGMLNRTLPHFNNSYNNNNNNSISPKAKGFVYNSFFSGLSSYEFFFHAVSGREGLVDTAVKTAETGYMQRRLMKALEDLSVKYDYTVRNSQGNIIQFVYGEDSMNPLFDEEELFFENIFNKSKSEFLIKKYTNDDTNDKTNDNYNDIKNMTNTFLDQFILSLSKIRFSHISHFFHFNHIATNLSNFLKIAKKRSFFYKNHFYQFFDKNDFLEIFFRNLKISILNSIIEPGTAVGAIAGQSIGEPGTQMTLKTFHFAGVASFNITLGVPRLKEIINGSLSISTPIVKIKLINDDKYVNKCDNDDKYVNSDKHVNTNDLYVNKCDNKHDIDNMHFNKHNLDNKHDIDNRHDINNKLHYYHLKLAALSVKGKLESTFFKDIVYKIKTDIFVDGINLIFFIDQNLIKNLFLGSIDQILSKIAKNGFSMEICSDGFKYSLKRVKDNSLFFIEKIKESILNVMISGLKSVNRVAINMKSETNDTNDTKVNTDNDTKFNTDNDTKVNDTHNNTYNNSAEIILEGHSLIDIMTTEGVNPYLVSTNNILEVESTLGIEAARTQIIEEIEYTMGTHGIKIDHRHLMLLSDTMCFRGKVLGITRFGIGKMRASTLMLASFEQTADYLFTAAVEDKIDPIKGVSESIIMGKPISIGTNSAIFLWRE